MRIRLSIRSLLLVTLSVAIFAAFIGSANASTDNVRMIIAVLTILSTFIVIPATSASCAYDVFRTRRSAELGAFYGFVAYSLTGIILGAMPAVH